MIWRHKKTGNLYTVFCIVKDSTNGPRDGLETVVYGRRGELVPSYGRERKEFEEKFEQCPDIVDEPLSELERLRTLINTPETRDFAKAVLLEAAHQRERWGSAHDAGKDPSDWFWLLGHLSGKAVQAHVRGDIEKAKHHTISSAAALANWHRHLSQGESEMRPGIDPQERGLLPAVAG